MLYEERSFPVVELARSLSIWLRDPHRGDFEFDSMSFEEAGSVAVRATPTGWTFGSVFAPGSQSAPVDWAEVERCCRAFVSRVEGDLAGLGVDAGKVIGR